MGLKYWFSIRNHPCKELIWVVQPDDNVTDSAPYGKQPFNYTDAYDQSYVPAVGPWVGSNSSILSPAGDVTSGSMPGMAAGGANQVYIPVSFDHGTNPVSIGKLQLNGHDRFSEREGRYFNLVQPYQHHENVPSQGINVYSFALKPEEHQPSGTCNMSRIDNATLQLTLTPATVAGGRTCKIRVYAVNYNVNCALKSHVEKTQWLVIDRWLSIAIHLDAGSSLELTLPLIIREYNEEHG